MNHPTAVPDHHLQPAGPRIRATGPGRHSTRELAHQRLPAPGTATHPATPRAPARKRHLMLQAGLRTLALGIAASLLLSTSASAVAPLVSDYVYGAHRCGLITWGADEGGPVEHTLKVEYPPSSYCSVTYNDKPWPASPTLVSNCGGASYMPGLKWGIEIQNGKDPTVDLVPRPSCAYSTQDGVAVTRTRTVECPAGTTASMTPAGVDCVPADLIPDKNPDTCPAGSNGSNPINSATGYKIQHEVDYRVPNSVLQLERTYSSRPQQAAATLGAGNYWRHSYDRRIVYVASDAIGAQPGTIATPTAFLERPNSARYYYRPAATNPDGSIQFVGDADVHYRLRHNPNESLWSWELITPSNDYEYYDAAGRLISITTADNRSSFLTYTHGVLTRVEDEAGRALTFAYDTPTQNVPSGRLSSITLPDGQLIAYAYDAYGMLSTVTYPSLPGSPAVRTYRYAEANVSGQPGARSYQLTGIVDERGERYASWGYAGDQAVLSVHGDKNSYINRVELVPTWNYASTLVKQWIDPATVNQVTYQFDIKLGVAKLRHVSSAPCASCGYGTAQTLAYDAAGHISSITDFRGMVTERTVDARGLESQRVEAQSFGANASPAEKRTLQTQWHADFRVPVMRSLFKGSNTAVAPESRVRWSYNTRGQMTARCEIDVNVAGADAYGCGTSTDAPAGVRQWLINYCEAADIAMPSSNCPLVGLAKSINGPRATADAGLAGLDDITSYAYYPGTDESGCASLGGTCHRKGDLWKVTNALGQVTESVSYDKNGRVTRSKDANGTITDMTYHPRGWLLTRTVRALASGAQSRGDATTTLTYNAAGNVTRITQPEGSYLDFSYDNAQRMTAASDNLSNRTQFTRNSVGEITQKQTFDSGNVLRRTLSQEFNALSRLVRVLNAANQPMHDSTAFDGAGLQDGYDANGNLVHAAELTGTADVQTRQSYDPLNRLVQTLQDTAGSDASTHNASTSYAYDTRNNRTKVTDPSGLDTTYTYDGLDNLVALDSPDTGHTAYVYDRAGNRLAQTDSRLITSSSTYDALNRVTAVTYADTTQNVHFSYDESNSVTGCATSFPAGRLTRMTDNSGSTLYCYDRRGNVVKKSQVILGLAFATEYSWDKNDRLVALTYPNGAIASFGRDTTGRVSRIDFQANALAKPTTVVSNASYYPFGPLNQLTFGNARTLTKTLDQNYAIDKVVSSDAGGLILDFATDRLGNIVESSDSIGANPPARRYTYDNLFRLRQVSSGANVLLEDYGYNLAGDRTSRQLGAQPPEIYTYLAGTHHLAAIDGVTRNYDPAGNLESVDGGATLVYDERNRLSDYQGSPNLAHYTYNGRGERSGKRISSPGSLGFTETLTIYDETGKVLEYRQYGVNQAGKRTLQKTVNLVYLGKQPVAQVSNGSLSYLEADHLGTPRLAADPATNAAQWSWDFLEDSFGNGIPANLSGSTVDVSLRYPGQVYDSESGFHYNYFRDYEAATGRYVESDPIGLASGDPSTYAYARSAPLTYIDPNGLAVRPPKPDKLSSMMDYEESCKEENKDEPCDACICVQDYELAECKLKSHCIQKARVKGGACVSHCAQTGVPKFSFGDGE